MRIDAGRKAMKKQGRLAIYILILGLILTGCSGPKSQTESNIKDGEKSGAEVKENGKTQEEKQAEATKARAELEAQRKAEMGEFYVPLPPLGGEQELTTVKAKALYLTANVAGFDFNEADVEYYADYIRSISGQSDKPADGSRLPEINKLEKALGICEATEINALVIDVKNDDGVVAWNSDVGIVNRIKSNASAPIKDYGKLMDYLKKKEIYRIARIVAFKDPYFAGLETSHAIQLKAGGVYKDYSGKMWVNPFDEYVWKYLIAISKEAALRGFQEIQYDYVRFPDDAKTYNPITEFPGRNGRDKDEGIEDFLKFAGKELEPYHVHMAADVFGIITHSWDDKPEDIGQTWRKIANQVDYICPMVYPSHYGTGLYGFDVPDQHPYEIVRISMMEAIERNAAQKKPGIIRPWIQGFNANWVKGHINYDAGTISSQLAASSELGIDEYIIWNAGNTYDPMTFFYKSRINPNVRKSGEDLVARTPELTLVKYLDAAKNQRFSVLYLLTPIGERAEDFDEFAAAAANGSILKNYEILSINKNDDGSFTANVNEEYGQDAGTAQKSQSRYKIILEKDVYKVKKAK